MAASPANNLRSKSGRIMPTVYIPSKNLPPDLKGPIYKVGNYICESMTDIISRELVDGAQLYNGTWRLQTKDYASRAALLTHGLELLGHSVQCLSKCPYMVDGEETHKLIIGNIPFSVPEDDIKKALTDLGIKLGGEMHWECYRDRSKNQTSFKSGRRFIYIVHPKKPLPRSMNVGNHTKVWLEYKNDKADPSLSSGSIFKNSNKGKRDNKGKGPWQGFDKPVSDHHERPYYASDAVASDDNRSHVDNDIHGDRDVEDRSQGQDGSDYSDHEPSFHSYHSDNEPLLVCNTKQPSKDWFDHTDENYEGTLNDDENINLGLRSSSNTEGYSDLITAMQESDNAFKQLSQHDYLDVYQDLMNFDSIKSKQVDSNSEDYPPPSGKVNHSKGTSKLVKNHAFVVNKKGKQTNNKGKRLRSKKAHVSGGKSTGQDKLTTKQQLVHNSPKGKQPQDGKPSSYKVHDPESNTQGESNIDKPPKLDTESNVPHSKESTNTPSPSIVFDKIAATSPLSKGVSFLKRKKGKKVADKNQPTLTETLRKCRLKAHANIYKDKPKSKKKKTASFLSKKSRKPKIVSDHDTSTDETEEPNTVDAGKTHEVAETSLFDQGD